MLLNLGNDADSGANTLWEDGASPCPQLKTESVTNSLFIIFFINFIYFIKFPLGVFR